MAGGNGLVGDETKDQGRQYIASHVNPFQNFQVVLKAQMVKVACRSSHLRKKPSSSI